MCLLCKYIDVWFGLQHEKQLEKLGKELKEIRATEDKQKKLRLVSACVNQHLFVTKSIQNQFSDYKMLKLLYKKAWKFSLVNSLAFFINKLIISQLSGVWEI